MESCKVVSFQHCRCMDMSKAWEQLCLPFLFAASNFHNSCVLFSSTQNWIYYLQAKNGFSPSQKRSASAHFKILINTFSSIRNKITTSEGSIDDINHDQALLIEKKKKWNSCKNSLLFPFYQNVPRSIKQWWTWKHAPIFTTIAAHDPWIQYLIYIIVWLQEMGQQNCEVKRAFQNVCKPQQSINLTIPSI